MQKNGIINIGVGKMGKYELVASHYDLYRHEYLNEIVIRYPNIDLTNLETIDHFTSRFSEIELFKKISEYNALTNQNHLSIRYLKKKNMNPNYFKVIYENSMIYNMSNQVECRMTGSYEHPYANAVPMNETFHLEFREIEDILTMKNIQRIIDFFGENHPLSALAQQYLKCDSYDYEGLEQIKQRLKQEFSRYKTFRGWIISKKNPIRKKKNLIIKTESLKKKEKIILKTIEEYEQEFENNFLKENNMSYKQQQLNDYNRRYLEEDQEEFIDESEMDQMGYTKRIW